MLYVIAFLWILTAVLTVVFLVAFAAWAVVKVAERLRGQDPAVLSTGEVRR